MSNNSDTTPRRRRLLPVGPLGMFLITAVAIAAAFGAAALAMDLLGEESEAIDIQEALNGAPQPLVSDPDARAEVGAPAPNARLEFLDGDSGFMAELVGTGTPAVINFWSSTCVPCLKEMPAFEEVHQELGDEVTFVGIDVVDTVQEGRKMVERTGVTYPNARDPRSEIFAAYGGVALPRTVVVDGDGTILVTHSGELDADELREMLASHDLIAT